ncbi:leucine-rich repeat protein soc-2-like isoform X2 [Drosophila obscura]|uniref:leucine-rich repeat protein soc-2-like isoform X2 n=1 Tax=Drosophila obscura TaxID=7282 RepID=UPI001BB2C568|nr:leucine-rich repeat protein soc-2-like isoform X2 [Drosophila obscura]
MDLIEKIDEMLPLYPKCERARETGVLVLAMDFNYLNSSNLTVVPPVVFNIMSHAQVKECDISGNLLNNIPPQLALDFQALTKLNISHNFLAILPVEMGNLPALETLDLSSNLFYALPDIVFKLPHLSHLYAQNNFISEFDLSQPIKSDRMNVFDLRYNPLNSSFRIKLVNKYTKFRLVLNEEGVYNEEEQ